MGKRDPLPPTPPISVLSFSPRALAREGGKGMRDGSFFIAELYRIIQDLPALAALIAGLVLAISRAQRHPKASTAAAIGFGGLLFLHVAGFIASIFLIDFAMRRETLVVYQAVQVIFSLGNAVLGAACYGVLVYGYFFLEGRGDLKPAKASAGSAG